MIKQHVAPVPAHRTRESAIRKGTLGPGTEADIPGRVSREVGAVDPEAEEGVGEGGGVVDEDLGDVDLAD